MKTALQIAASVAALTGLLFGAASQATPLAELPLKASVLAKPNVIFGMDDSGSMDWELLFDTSQGVVWWDGTTSWDSANNRPLRSSGMVPYTYLMPVGTAAGGAIYAYNSWYGQSVPPTTQFAWLRSARFNPLYYNSTVTYPAWSPAYLSGASVSYANAPSAAAPAHPAVAGAPTLNLGTDWSSAHASFTSNGFMFYLQAGMTLPVGSVVPTTAADATGTACSGSTWRTLTAAQTVAAGRACWSAIPYYPATFWHAEACTANGSTCITAPDGTTTLKRYEIKAATASYPSGRGYTAEMQNFANWFTYYRKRKLMLAGSMGRVLENLTGLRLGVVPFNQTPTVTMYDADNTTPATNRRVVAGQFYLNSMTAQGTPTHATMRHIGSQFDTNTGIVQYACQRNSMFIVTDGFANSHSQTAPSYNASTYGAGTPYTTTTANSLADFALAYYTNRLRTDLPAGRVPLGDAARVPPLTNRDLHISTYALTLGARGTLFPTATDPFATNVWATPPTWPTPVADDPTMLDDLWHATVNGRGRMYMANDVDAMRLNVQAVFNDILNQAGAQGGVAVSAVNLDRSDSQAYLGVYNPRGWAGDLTANPISVTTAAVSATPNWSAATVLAARTWSTRVIFSSNASGGIDFSDANVGATVNPNTAVFTSNPAVVEYLRGNRAGEGTTFRTRSSLIGAVVNAEPVLARDDFTVYLASGDGMLHALDTATGAERWAYAPPDILAALGRSIERGWVYQTLLDASPTFARLSTGSKLLVGGLGAAGRSYYALDVSSPRNLDIAGATAQYRWIFPTAADTANRANMGYTVGRPVIARTAADGNVVLVTSGYDNGQAIGDSRGRLWMLNAATGAVIKTFRTTAGAVAPGQEAGLAQVSAFKESDGTTRYVYGGDLRGNLWKFDLARTGAGELDAELLATLLDASSNPQPVMSAPELTTVASKRVVLVGTGRLLDIGDFGSSGVQSFYAIADGTTLTNARTGLVRQTYTRSTDTMSTNTVNWTTDRGWYFDLTAGEQANTDPVVAYGAVAFVTNVNGGTDCAQAAYMYLVDIGTGTKVSTSTFVSQTIATDATSSRVIALRVVNGRIIGTTHRSDNTVYQRELPVGQTITPAKNAWREIRR